MRLCGYIEVKVPRIDILKTYKGFTSNFNFLNCDTGIFISVDSVQK